jgi:hypothetical protein
MNEVNGRMREGNKKINHKTPHFIQSLSNSNYAMETHRLLDVGKT